MPPRTPSLANLVGRSVANRAPASSEARAKGLRAAKGYRPLYVLPAGAAAARGAIEYGGKRVAKWVRKLVTDAYTKDLLGYPKQIGVDIAAGFGAGAGAFHLREGALEEGRNPDTNEALGALLGAGAAVVAPAALGAAVRGAVKASPAARYVVKNFAPFNEQAGGLRAADRMQRQSSNVDEAVAALDEPTIANLSPATRTGQRGPLAIERAARANDPVLDARLRANEEGAEEQLRQAMIDIAEGGDPKAFAAFIREMRASTEGELNDAVTAAYRKTELALSKLAPGQSREAVSIVLRQELDLALKAARAEETRLWKLIPREVIVGTVNARAAFINAEKELGKATFNRMPPGVRALLGKIPKSERMPAGMEIAGETVAKTGRRLKAKESAHELIELMSEMREVARKARSDGEFLTARIADNIADGALADLDAVADIGATQAAARAFSRGLHDKFTRGNVGKVLGYAGEGGAAVPAERTAAMLLGKTEEAGKVSSDDMIRATSGSPNAMAAAEDYLKSRFAKHTMVKGEFDPEKAAVFLRDNSGMLENFPALKNLMHDSAQAGVMAEGLGGIIKGAIRQTGKGTVSGRIETAKHGREYATILQAKNTRAAARTAARLARKDQTGAATRGLKAAAIDDLIAKASTGGTLSGKAMRNALKDKDTRAALGEILTTAEMKRLGQISGELRKLAIAQGKLPDIGGVINDPINKLINVLGTLLGSEGGVRAARNIGGHSLVVSGFFTRNAREMLASMTNSTAERLLREAVVDPEVMKALLMSADTPAKAALIEKRLGPWMLAEFGQAGIAASESENRFAPVESPLPLRRQ